jgi:HemY protein
LRSLAFEALDTARDAEQLRRVWLQFDNADRRDAFVAARAASRAAGFGQPDEGRSWLRPFWERLSDLGADERAALANGLVDALPGLGAEWLPRLEAAAQTYPRESAINHAVGCALAERQLWGKAKVLLESAAADTSLAAAARRQACLTLARIAEHQDQTDTAARYYEQAARIA